MESIVLRPGEGETLDGALVCRREGWVRRDGRHLLPRRGNDRSRLPGPPPHTHEKLHDMSYVLEGGLTLRVGDETIIAGPGTFVCVPAGKVHTFSNQSDAPVRFLNFNTPGGWERYMRALGEEQPSTQEGIGRIASRFDFKPV